VRVAVSTLVDDGRALVDVMVRIDEGAQQVLADVAVSGADITSPGVIARALELEPGDPASPIDLPHAEKRLYDTGVFRTASVAFEPVGENDDGVQPVRAEVTLSELSPFRFRYGFRLNDDMGPAEAGRETRPALVVDLLRRNLFGRAVSAGAAGQVEPDRRLARGVVSLPRLLGLPLMTSFFLTTSRQSFTPEGETPFVEDESSVTAEQRLRPTSSTSVSYGYTFSRTHVFEPTPVAGLPGLELLARVARLTGTFAWDRRDDPFNAREGWFHSSGLEYGPASLGSDLRFLKYLGQHYYFKTIGRNISLASGVRLGLGRGFGQDLIRSEKFYAGGGTSVRGFAEDGIGGADFLGDPVGGNGMLILNEEMRFPIFKWFRGVAFVDAGNVFPTVTDFSLADLASGAGVGVRVDSPVGLLRIDLGVPLTDRERERAARWYFGIGHAF
jgi:outer membrane protein assembly factor BamA